MRTIAYLLLASGIALAESVDETGDGDSTGDGDPQTFTFWQDVADLLRQRDAPVAGHRRRHLQHLEELARARPRPDRRLAALQQGQTIEVTCTDDTSGDDEAIYPGWGTYNEMCLTGLYLVPTQ